MFSAMGHTGDQRGPQEYTRACVLQCLESIRISSQMTGPIQTYNIPRRCEVSLTMSFIFKRDTLNIAKIWGDMVRKVVPQISSLVKMILIFTQCGACWIPIRIMSEKMNLRRLWIRYIPLSKIYPSTGSNLETRNGLSLIPDSTRPDV